MSSYQQMYEWGFLNDTSKNLEAFESFSVTELQITDSGLLVLVAGQFGEDLPTAVVGPTPVKAHRLGSCAFPSAFWARVEPQGIEAGSLLKVTEDGLMEKDDEGTFVAVGEPDDDDKTIVVPANLTVTNNQGGGGTDPGPQGPPGPPGASGQDCVCATVRWVVRTTN